MKHNRILKSLESKLDSNLKIRRYQLPDMISESYRTLYECSKGTNLHRLVESHIEDVRSNPADIERLSRQLAIIKEGKKMIESSELKDEDLVPKEKYTPVEPPKDEEIKESKAEEDLLEDTELTDEEVDELTKHLAELRKNKKLSECGDNSAPGDKPMEEAAVGKGRPLKRKVVEAEDPSPELQDHIMTKLADMIREFGVDPDSVGDKLDDLVYHIAELSTNRSLGEARDFKWDDDLWAVVKEDGTYAGIPCRSYEEARELSYHPGSKIFKLTLDDDMDEATSWDKVNLSQFRENSSGKAFMKTFKKLGKQLKEGTALTRQETISLYKAANSAMTHLSVELEHNPEFLGTFSESVSLLSADISKLLESMKKDKAPSKSTMKSLAKFSEALLREDDEEELPPVEDEEDSYVGAEDSEEATEQFDQEYADARFDLHKELADAHEGESPEIDEKIAQDAEEVASLPGISEEQAEELLGGESEESEDSEEEAPAEETTEEEAPEDTDESREELSLGDEDDAELTDEELAELKRHLHEMRKARSEAK